MKRINNKTTIDVGDNIEVNHRPVFSTKEGPNWTDAVVESLLSETFTYYYTDTGRVGWCFYKDHGDSWRKPK